ncbi:MAG TPA: response regulator [Anaeromyxobacteraceae bacterium]|nr:response regulator [Anaeromyxobacteraceae bacterium]
MSSAPSAVLDSACGARVLVVDDEALVGRAVARVLGKRHDVAVATSGREALALLEGGREFDLVLCDIMMPGMDGMDLYRTVAERHPGMTDRFVFLTGGAFTLEAEAFLAATKVERIIKPFDSAALRLLAAARARR